MESYLARCAAELERKIPPHSPEYRDRLDEELNDAYVEIELLYQAFKAGNRKPSWLRAEELAFIEDTLAHWKERPVNTRKLIRAAIIEYAQWQRADRDLKALMD